ncbi:MAG: GIY-YIG nuclease family protein [Calothrix sp. FI2-JRJ7]|jgi:excinuclease UvrABC nuclease subunit|nr:GIY-YIG nuclease family protein [Calothrix sp. FI2-JRJ7]
MIGLEQPNLKPLPWVSLNAKSQLPATSGIYIAINSQNKVEYIGRSVNIRQRWENHHRYKQLKSIGGIKLCYLAVENVDLLNRLETALITCLKPPLNFTRVQSSKKKQRIATKTTIFSYELGEITFVHDKERELLKISAMVLMLKDVFTH